MAQVAEYVDLCSRLSRFVPLQPTSDNCKALQEVLDDLVLFYDRLELASTAQKLAEDAPLVGLAAMDDLVLHSMHRLLGAFILTSASVELQERSFVVFANVVRRCKPRMKGINAGQVQRRLAFVQSCVLYLPSPPEVGDGQEEVPGSMTLVAQSEELRLAILQSLRELLDEGVDEEKQQQLQVDQQHFFAYLVASLLHVAQRDRCREAALQAIEVLKCVLLFVRDPQTLRQYLPGVAAGLWKSANAPQQASMVIVAALQCLAKALEICVGDDHLPEGNDEAKQEHQFTLEAIRQSFQSNTNKTSDSTTLGESTEKSPDKSDKWLETTAINLDLLLSRMFAASATATVAGTSTGLPRSSWRVRCALAELCGVVMLHCRQSLRVSFFRCYDELLVLRGDSIAEVAQAADSVLQKLQVSALSVEERLRLLPEMANRFQMLLSTLVLKVATEHEATKVHLVRTLRGYVAFLGSSLTPYLDASMENIYSSLCRVVSFAALDIELVVNQTLPNPADNDESNGVVGAGVVVSQFQKRLRFFNEEASVREVLMMLRDIGAVATPSGFVDCAFTLLSEADTLSAEAGGAEVMLVLNEFLRAFCPSEESTGVNGSAYLHLVGRVLEDLLALKAWEEHTSSSNRSVSKTLVSQCALMVECVGVCAQILGVEFKLFLLHVLYPLVEQLGSHSVEVERAALAALEKVYFFTGYESLEALFQANMDYFVDALCARLEQLDMYPMTAFVVEALLRHTRLASLPLVDEVSSSLLRSVDLYQDSPHVDGLLRALKNLLSSIAQDAEASQVDNIPVIGDDRMANEPASCSLLMAFIHEMNVLTNGGIDTLDIGEESNDKEEHPDPEHHEHSSVKGAMPLEYDEVQPDDQDDSQDNDDNTDGSGYRTLVIDIMDRCGYFLVDSDPIACCLVLSLIDEGVRFLSGHQKQLLPLIARMWPELLPRLRVDNRAIVTGTVRVVATLAEVAGDFVGDRFVETVWPILRSQMQSIDFGDGAKSQLTRSMLMISKPTDEVSSAVETQESGKTESSELSAVNGTRKTQEIRQLLAILSCLTLVCQQSEPVTQLVPEITKTCSKYLSHAAPREVVEQTFELFTALVQLNGDQVFCTVAALAEWVPPTPPSARFSGYERDAVRRFYRGHLSAVNGHAASCRDNALILMNRLFS